MKRQYPTSAKSRALTGYHQHLRKEGKRRANKATRRLARPGRKLRRWFYEGDAE